MECCALKCDLSQLSSNSMNFGYCNTFDKVDMEKATVNSVKQYAYEILDYVDSIYLFIDVVASIILWRGRVVVSIKNPFQKEQVR